MHGSVLLCQFDISSKGGPLSGLTFDQKSAPVAIHHVFNDGQAQPSTPPLVTHFAFDTEEPFAEAGKEPALDALAGVLNPNVGVGAVGGGDRRQQGDATSVWPTPSRLGDHVIAVTGSADFNDHRPTVSRVLDGVI